MKRDEERIVMAVVLTAVIITSAMLVYSLLTLPPQEGFPAISVLNQDGVAVGLVQVNNATQFHFYVLVENHLGHIGYFLVDIWRGQIFGDTNPPLNSCTHWGNLSRIIVGEGGHVFRVNDTLLTTQTNEQYIYYCILNMYDTNAGDFKNVLNAFGEMTMVWMQVNVTA